MKFLSKLIALSCAVCMVGVVRGSEVTYDWNGATSGDVYCFKKDSKWYVAYDGSTITFIKLIANMSENSWKNLVSNILAPNTDFGENIKSYEDTKNKKLNIFVLKQPLEKKFTLLDKLNEDKNNEEYKASLHNGYYNFKDDQTPLDLINKALEEYDKKEKYRETIMSLTLKELQKKLEEASLENYKKEVLKEMKKFRYEEQNINLTLQELKLKNEQDLDLQESLKELIKIKEKAETGTKTGEKKTEETPDDPSLHNLARTLKEMSAPKIV